VLNLLNDAYKIGSDGLPAPQANLMGTVAFGVFEGGLPKTIIGIGAAIAVVVIAIDSLLARSGSKIRVPVMAFAVGVYLPFHLSVPIFLGGVIAWLVTRALDRSNASPERRGEVERSGLLAAAGFITGEALLGIGLAVPVAITHDDKVLVLAGGKYDDLKLPALLFVGLVLVLLYKLALRKEGKPIPPA
jgi:putative OPT family oligopeptide transporter